MYVVCYVFYLFSSRTAPQNLTSVPPAIVPSSRRPSATGTRCVTTATRRTSSSCANSALASISSWRTCASTCTRCIPRARGRKRDSPIQSKSVFRGPDRPAASGNFELLESSQSAWQTWLVYRNFRGSSRLLGSITEISRALAGVSSFSPESLSRRCSRLRFRSFFLVGLATVSQTFCGSSCLAWLYPRNLRAFSWTTQLWETF